MAKARQDAWSHEDDLLLAETVLRHIREGGTQLNAFEEVGDQLNRTSAACGFRWNAEIRNKYIDAIDLAKRQRKEKKRRLAKQQANVSAETESQYKPDVQANSEPEDTNRLIENDATSFVNDKMTEEKADLTLEQVIEFLSGLKQDYDTVNQSHSTISELKQENKALHNKVSDLTKQIESAQNELKTIKEDYQVFMQIMDRARKMTVLEDQGALQSPAFRMDKNGNLEQIAQSSNQ